MMFNRLRSHRLPIGYYRRFASKPIKPPKHATTTPKPPVSYDQLYANARKKFENKKLPLDVDSTAVFACNTLDLSSIEVYGFDYDYTLAVYNRSMLYLLYNLARQVLVERLHYPPEILKFDFQPHWAVRGLHYDHTHGLLLKLDMYLQIQQGAVYRGLEPISDDEVLRLYGSRTLSNVYVEGTCHSPSSGAQKMVPLADLFAVPEMVLLSQVAEYFRRSAIDYHPQILFRDTRQAVGASHGLMHEAVMANPAEYILPNALLVPYLQRLVDAGKQLFIITNSPFEFVNAGMELLVGCDWRKFFDLIVVQAAKPGFFTDTSSPLCLYDERIGYKLWDRVERVEKGRVYMQGSVQRVQELMGWRGPEVIYFGDHPYSDLADLTLQHGWRTVAIIRELEHEIRTLNNEEYKRAANWLQMLTQLIEDRQEAGDSADARLALAKWGEERKKLRQLTKSMFNMQFGSVFRTFHNPTNFSRRLFRLSDVYTSSISNMMNYSVNHTFYPRRGVMPHEYFSYFM